MSKRTLVLEVKVVEYDENHNVVATHCEHAESYRQDYFLARQDELLQCAYEGFDLARNRFCGLDDENM